MRDRLASWLNDIDPQATVLPEREAMETGSSLLFVMTASRWAAMRLRVLPFTWSSVVSEVQKAPEERHYQSGDIIAPTGR